MPIEVAGKQRPGVRQRLVYSVDFILSKGMWGFLVLTASGALCLLLFVVPFLLAVKKIATNEGSWSHLPQLIWAGFARVFGLGNAQGAWVDQVSGLVLAIMATFFSGLVFAVLFGSVAGKMTTLRSTGGEIIAESHTVILGWSGVGVTILEQLVCANENQRKPTLAILDSRPKSENENSIRRIDTRNTRVLFRKGEADTPDDFDTVRVDLADRVIVLADWAAENHDEQVVTSLLALSRYKEKKPHWDGSVVALLKSDSSQGPAAAAAAAHYPLSTVDVGQFVSRLMLRTTLQPGLYSVYSELFNFNNDELYFVSEPALTGMTFGEALMCYPDTSPVGLANSKGSFLHPDFGTVIGPEDKIVVIAHDDDTAILGPVAEPDEVAIAMLSERIPATDNDVTNWLFIGWSPALPDVLDELSSYTADAANVTIVCREQHLTFITDAYYAYPRLKVAIIPWPDHIDAESMLKSTDIASFNYVLIFNQQAGPELPHSSTLMVMLHATAIAQSLPAEDRPLLVTQLIDPRLRKLCQTGYGDIVVDSDMVALVTAQLSENPGLLPVLVDLCDASGSEIYLKNVCLYVTPGPMTYSTLVESARRRGEIAIGYRRCGETADLTKNSGITLNVNKNLVIDVSHFDQLIVLAEDAL